MIRTDWAQLDCLVEGWTAEDLRAAANRLWHKSLSPEAAGRERITDMAGEAWDRLLVRATLAVQHELAARIEAGDAQMGGYGYGEFPKLCPVCQDAHQTAQAAQANAYTHQMLIPSGHACGVSVDVYGFTAHDVETAVDRITNYPSAQAAKPKIIATLRKGAIVLNVDFTSEGGAEIEFRPEGIFVGPAADFSAHPNPPDAADSGRVTNAMVDAYVSAVNEYLGNMTEAEWLQADRLDKHAHLSRVARIGLVAALAAHGQSECCLHGCHCGCCRACKNGSCEPVNYAACDCITPAPSATPEGGEGGRE